jgi:hypothetical protein
MERAGKERLRVVKLQIKRKSGGFYRQSYALSVTSKIKLKSARKSFDAKNKTIS